MTKRKKEIKEWEVINGSNNLIYFRYRPLYRTITGKMRDAVLLSRIMDLFSIHKKYKISRTDSKLRKDTSLTDYEIRKAKQNLKTVPFLLITKEGQPAKTHYSIDCVLYKEWLTRALNQKGNKV